VVGRNGAGKTTLMNMIANNQVQAIPPQMVTVHVKPEVLDSHLDMAQKAPYPVGFGIF
jgi:ATPase subunit of ABC transporter with duplicated ATPase domains